MNRTYTSPFLDSELFTHEPDLAQRQRTEALVAGSPFLDALMSDEETDAEAALELGDAETDDAAYETHGLSPEFPPDTELDAAELIDQFVPAVSSADLRARIDEFFDLANHEYTLEDGTVVRARGQFRYAKSGEIDKRVKALVKAVGAGFEKKHPRAIHFCVYGRPTLDQLGALTQALIDAGKLKDVRDANPGMTNAQLVRQLQRDFGIGIDCAGYVQLAFIHAFTGSANDSASVRLGLGLDHRRGWERLDNLRAPHFKKVKLDDAKTGDLFVLTPRRGDADRAIHTVMIVEHTVSGTEHTFVGDASWGVDLYGRDVGGVQRRKLVFDSASKEWWDIHPRTGAEANRNSTGPYAGHGVQGFFRPVVKPAAKKPPKSTGSRELFAPDPIDVELEEEWNELETEIDAEAIDDFIDATHAANEQEVDEAEEAESASAMEYQVHTLNPGLLDLAERIARRRPLLEHDLPRTKKFSRLFSNAEIARVREAYENNATAAGGGETNRCSCIVMLNVALGKLLPLKRTLSLARGTSSRRVEMAALTTQSIERAMAQLQRLGLALRPIVMDFVDSRGRRAGTLKPLRLSASVSARILRESPTDGSWYAYGLSVMDGYHSVLVLVDRTGASPVIFWLDQFSTSIDDNVTTTLDDRLTDMTQRWWQHVKDTKNKGYNTMIRIWPLGRRK